MLKKILLGTLFIGLVGLLVFGAVNRTIAKSGTPFAIGLSRQEAATDLEATPQPGVTGEYHQGEGGLGRANRLEGAQDGDCTGQGGGSGYWKNQEANQDGNQGQGQGGGKGQGQAGGRSGQGRNSGGWDSEHTEILPALATLEGTVTSVTPEALVIATADAGDLIIEGRAWRFALENGYTIQVNQQVRVSGFEEGGEFKAVSISDGSNQFQFRDQNGRPSWAGRGQGGGGNSSGNGRNSNSSSNQGA
jgi:hypothetical protein